MVVPPLQETLPFSQFPVEQPEGCRKLQHGTALHQGAQHSERTSDPPCHGMFGEGNLWGQQLSSAMFIQRGSRSTNAEKCTTAVSQCQVALIQA